APRLRRHRRQGRPGLDRGHYRAVDRGHAQLLRDRGTLDAVGRAVEHVTRDREVAARASADGDPLSIGELARRLGVTAATLRN
ncbi:hypothetical protein ACWEFK_19500, partial [Streptomyces sp. NPDC004830]